MGMRVENTERRPIKLWLDNIEDGALEQAKNIANLPFLHRWVAIMPDAHQGYGMPIGGVAALDGYISPNMVGVDIGCGMCAVRTTLTEIPDIRKLMGEIRKVVPVGFKHHEDEQSEDLMPSPERVYIAEQQYKSALKQLGTLGGGNHFIEIQQGSDGYIWIMVHSGSRNIGYKVAQHYNKKAKELNQKYFSIVPKEHDLAFFRTDADEGYEYIREMKYCVAFAFANRSLMMQNIQRIFVDETGCDFDPMINIAHNYADIENHQNKNVWVHRKGATRAREGEIGIIPGSQGTKSYIVKGLGNEESFKSCSHGAGRTMGRKQAQRDLSLEEEIARLDGIVHSIRSQNDLDEAPSAYKDITEVMANQTDLVEIQTELTPLGVIKG
jgi:tRNA-splicing ligase RtcB